MPEQQRWTWLDRVLIAAVALVVLGGAVGSLVRPDLFQPRQRRPQPETRTLRQTGIAPAPKVVLGSRRKVGGRIVSSWIASGAGDSSYNGVYNPSGTVNGYPAYTNGSRWLYYAYMIGSWALPGWVLSPDATSSFNCPYQSWATELPGLWHVTGVPPADPPPIAPAPTVTAGPTGPDWPWDWWLWPYDPPIQGPNNYIRPCRATIGGTDYVVFPWHDSIGHGAFNLFDIQEREFTKKTAGTAHFFASATDHDPGQTMCAYDAGDGTHIYLCSGSFLNDTQPQFTISAWDVATPNPVQADAETLNLPSVHITPFLQTPGSPDTFRFLSVSAEGEAAGLWEYVAFSGGLALIGEAAVPALPTGFSQVVCAVDDIHRWDHVLYQKDATLYWMRHCKDGSTPPQHRIVAATVA